MIEVGWALDVDPRRFTTILKYIEYGAHSANFRALSKIIFYLLQDGCKLSKINKKANKPLERVVFLVGKWCPFVPRSWSKFPLKAGDKTGTPIKIALLGQLELGNGFKIIWFLFLGLLCSEDDSCWGDLVSGPRVGGYGA